MKNNQEKIDQTRQSKASANCSEVGDISHSTGWERPPSLQFTKKENEEDQAEEEISQVSKGLHIDIGDDPLPNENNSPKGNANLIIQESDQSRVSNLTETAQLKFEQKKKTFPASLTPPSFQLKADPRIAKSTKQLKTNVIQKADPEEEEAKLQVIFPYNIGTATSFGEAADNLSDLYSMVRDLNYDLADHDTYDYDSTILDEFQTQIWDVGMTVGKNHRSKASFDAVPVLILRSFVKEVENAYDKELSHFKSFLNRHLSKIRKTIKIDPMNKKMAEAKRKAFSKGDEGTLEKITKITDAAGKYNSKVSDYIGYASIVSDKIHKSTEWQKLKDATGNVGKIYGHATKVFEGAKVLMDITTDGKTGEQDAIQKVEAGLQAIDIGLSFVKAVPVLGMLWSKYYYPVAKTCLKLISKISAIKGRENRQLTGILSDWHSPVPPKISSLGFPGGQAVFSFMWHLFFGTYAPSSDAKEYFYDNSDDFNAGARSKLKTERNGLFWHNKHVINLSSWAKENKEDIWFMLYGADMPFPGHGAVEASIREYNDDVVQRSTGIPMQFQHDNDATIPAEQKSKVEHNIGMSLSGVNIKTDSSEAKDAGALAFAQGNNIHFAPGQFKPETRSGQELIGHELAHVEQQRQGKVKATTSINGMPVNDDKDLEKEADDFGVTFADNQASQFSIDFGAKRDQGPFQLRKDGHSILHIPDEVTQKKEDVVQRTPPDEETTLTPDAELTPDSSPSESDSTLSEDNVATTSEADEPDDDSTSSTRELLRTEFESYPEESSDEESFDRLAAFIANNTVALRGSGSSLGVIQEGSLRLKGDSDAMGYLTEIGYWADLQRRKIKAADELYATWHGGDDYSETDEEVNESLADIISVTRRVINTDGNAVDASSAAGLVTRAASDTYAWSASTISYIHWKAGMGDCFEYAEAHITYLRQAQRNSRRNEGVQQASDAFGDDAGTVEVGDVLVRSRDGGTHGDMVVSIEGFQTHEAQEGEENPPVNDRVGTYEEIRQQHERAEGDMTFEDYLNEQGIKLFAKVIGGNTTDFDMSTEEYSGGADSQETAGYNYIRLTPTLTIMHNVGKNNETRKNGSRSRRDQNNYIGVIKSVLPPAEDSNNSGTPTAPE